MAVRLPRVTPVRRGGVTQTGWGLAALAAVSWVVGERYRWPELTFLATVTGLLLATGLVLVVLPRRIHADLRPRPARVTAGEPAYAVVDVSGRAVRLLPPVIEVPVSDRDGRRACPTGRVTGSAGGSVRLELDLPTAARGVVDVGPATHVRTDPLGLYRRRREVTGSVRLHVWPAVVTLPSLASGIVHDLEGAASNTLVADDLSFHALREYEPGDDPRHVHWKSTARAGSLLVRQFQLTRRTHVTVLLDPEPGSYSASAEFELAVSVAASLAIRAMADDYEVTFGCGREVLTTREPKVLLDLCCRVERGGGTFRDTAVRIATESGGTSLVLVVTGARADPGESRHAVAHFPSGADSVVVRTDLAAAPRATRRDTHTTVEVAELAQLPTLLVRAAS